jgi:hypothetical protein
MTPHKCVTVREISVPLVRFVGCNFHFVANFLLRPEEIKPALIRFIAHVV